MHPRTQIFNHAGEVFYVGKLYPQSMHKSAGQMLYICHSGTMQLHLENSPPRYANHFLIPAGTRYAINPTQAEQSISVWLGLPIAHNRDYRLINSGVCSVLVDFSLQLTTADVDSATELFAQLHHLVAKQEQFIDFKKLDARIIEVIAQINQAPEQEISVAEFSAAAGLSGSHFSQLFKANTGVPLRRYRQWIRLLTALKKLADSATLTEAALSAGFNDAAYFSRSFNSQIGVNPSTLLQQSRIIVD